MLRSAVGCGSTSRPLGLVAGVEDSVRPLPAGRDRPVSGGLLKARRPARSPGSQKRVGRGPSQGDGFRLGYAACLTTSPSMTA